MSAMQLLIEQKRDALRQGLIELGGRVSSALAGSLDALRRRDPALAREIVAGDAIINRERRVLEQQALVVLAAHQPAGRDLRLIGASLEMIAELERIADHAADVARILLQVETLGFPESPLERIAAMGELAAAMFDGVMAAYAQNADAALALAAVASEDEVDAQEQATIQALTAWLCDHPCVSPVAIRLLWIAHHYERVADRATNIAERVVYVATGETPELN